MTVNIIEPTVGSTGNRATFLVLDSDGAPQTGVAYNAAGLAVAYTPKGGTQVAITLSSENWHEKGQGLYEVDVADAVYTVARILDFSGVITNGSIIAERQVVKERYSEASAQAAAAAAIAAAGLATAEQVAALSVIPTASVSETPTAGTITIRRGDYFSQAISGVGDIIARTYLWFTAKTAPSRQADSAARIQITEASGLTILNGEAYATAADGDLTVDEVAETVTIVLSADVTAALSAGQRMEWDLQILDATGKPETIATGTLMVTADVTRATEEPT